MIPAHKNRGLSDLTVIKISFLKKIEKDICSQGLSLGLK